MLQFHLTDLKFETREKCEQFRMMAFDLCCATCERSDQECPWGRQDEPVTTAQSSNTRTMSATAA